jgi:hypothetical protein
VVLASIEFIMNSYPAYTAERGDIHQVVAYAVQMKATKAMLIYLSNLSKSVHANVGDVSVQSVVFDIGLHDLGGYSFLRELEEALASSD